MNHPFKKTEPTGIFLVQKLSKNNLDTRLFDERRGRRYKPSVRNELFPVTPLQICKKANASSPALWCRVNPSSRGTCLSQPRLSLRPTGSLVDLTGIDSGSCGPSFAQWKELWTAQSLFVPDGFSIEPSCRAPDEGRAVLSCNSSENTQSSHSARRSAATPVCDCCRAPSEHGDGDVDPQVAVVGEQVGYRGVKHQAVAVHDGGRHAVVDGARRGLPCEPPPDAVELQPVGKVLGLLARADEQHDGKELLVALVFLLLLQHQHEVVAEAGLHHHPVHGARQVDVRRQEDDVLALWAEALIMLISNQQ